MPRPSHNPDETRPGHCQCGNPDPCPIVDRAQKAAERIAEMKLGIDPPGIYDWCVQFRDARKAPTDTGAIREALLSGHAWTSWLRDDRLADDMRLMHGPPASGDYGG
jgi:hypothetical protein